MSKYNLQNMEVQTYKQCKLALEEDPMQLQYVKNQTKKLCRIAIRINPMSLQYVRRQTDSMCRMAIDRNIKALKYVKNQTDEMCRFAITKNAFALKHVRNQTDELCELAVSKTPYALEYVRNQTKKFCLIALENSTRYMFHTVFSYIIKDPSKILKLNMDKYEFDDIIYKRILEAYLLECYKKDIQEIINYALSHFSPALKYIENPSYEQCKLAVKSFPNALEYIKNKTYELCKYAVEKNGDTLKYFVDEIDKICETEAMKYKVFFHAKIRCESKFLTEKIFEYVGVNSDELYKLAIGNFCNAILHIKPENRTKELIDFAISKGYVEYVYEPFNRFGGRDLAQGGGGLMQLVAYGQQDIYLTGEPQLTFMSVIYRRHTSMYF
uniref:DUF4116 domain-containing protein n=1 Tax=viral metagenome TaxID=1070528 RepID=A0A6C0EA46_9ZZZZ